MTRARDLADSADKDIVGTLTLDGLDVAGNVTFGDNDKAIFGSGSDLSIYHDGVHSRLKETGTGGFYFDVSNSLFIRRNDTSALMASFETGTAKLYYDNALKLATTSTGIDVSGTAVTDGLTVAGNVSVDGGTIKLDGNYPVGTQNVALGDAALDSNVSGSENTAIGSQALTAATASELTAVGYRALGSNTSGARNVAVGRLAAYSTTTGGSSVSFGTGAAYSNTSGSYNTALGDLALFSNTTASNNTAVGHQAAYSNTTGTNNTFIGEQAGYWNTTGSDNTVLGTDAYAATGSGATGNYNVAIGRQALRANTTASNNTAVGYQSLYSNLQSPNSAFGAYSLLSNTNGYSNNAFGISSLRNNTTGTRNAAFGESALNANTTGGYNTAMGNNALQSNTTASSNTAVGYQAGYVITTGTDNTFLGTFAGEAATTGASNTFVGRASGNTITTGAKNTILGRYNGNQGGLDIRTASNNIVLSDGDGNPRVYVNSNGYTGVNRTDLTYHFEVDSGAMSPAARFHRYTDGSSRTLIIFRSSSTGSTVGGISISNSSTSFNTSSDYRLKENVVELTGATERLKQLNPSRFNFIADADTTVDGFLAHEVQTVVPEAIHGTKDEVDADGNPVYQGIDQSKLVPLLVATIKELEARITALENA